MSKRRNPAWVDDALELNWEYMKSLVGQKWMPLSRLASFEGEPGAVYREYGSGNYGTVFPTRDPGVVLKITRDESEANLVAYTVDAVRRDLRGRMPEGLVRYYRISQLKTKAVPIFAIWREAALSTGDSALKQLSKMGCDQYEVTDWLYEYRSQAEWLRKYMSLVEPALSAMSETESRAARARVLESQDAVGVLKSTRSILKHMKEKIACLGPIARTFEYYLNHGVVLADVHEKNIGLVKRSRKTVLVITDPGHAYFLTPQTYAAPARVANRNRRR